VTDTFVELITVDGRNGALAVRDMLNRQGIEDVHVWPAPNPGGWGPRSPKGGPFVVLVAKDELLEAKRLVRNSDLKIERWIPPPLDGRL